MDQEFKVLVTNPLDDSVEIHSFTAEGEQEAWQRVEEEYDDSPFMNNVMLFDSNKWKNLLEEVGRCAKK